MKKFDLSIIGIVGIPARYGGFETFVEHFVKWTSSILEIRVFCSTNVYSKSEQVDSYLGVDLEYIGVSANGSMSIIYDMIGLFKSMYNSKVILVLGVSGGVFFPIVKLLSASKLVVNIDGLEWRRAKWSLVTRIYLRISELIAVKFADHIVVDNDVLAVYVKETYNKEAKVIAYGGDHLLESLALVHEKLEIDFLAIARIEPENNVHVILEAFKQNPFRKLTFIGNWKYSEYSRQLFNVYKNVSNLELVEAIYDNQILAKYRKSAKAYIHGHSAGGSNPSLIESIFYDVPILAFDCNFNRCTLKGTGYYWTSSADLSELLGINKMADSKDLKSRYSWNRISQSYLDLIRESDSF